MHAFSYVCSLPVTCKDAVTPFDPL